MRDEDVSQIMIADGGIDSVIGTDVKVVCNRVQMKALKGHSARDGRGSKCLNAGHDGKYIWIIGNLMGRSQHILLLSLN